MDNFEALNHYIIPSDILVDILDAYKLLGKNSEYQSKLEEKTEYIEKEVVEKDVYYFSKMLDIDISDNRLRLLITKDSTPKSRQEAIISGIKKVIVNIRNNAFINKTYNGSDILDYLKIIFGNKSVGFSKELSKPKKRFERAISIRLKYERVLEEYNDFVINKKFEPIFLSTVCYLEQFNLKPYTDFNEFACSIAMYYMMFANGVDVFKYVSFGQLYFNSYNSLISEVKIASVNYEDNYLNVAKTAKLVFKMIFEAYSMLDMLVKNYYYNDRAFKSDVIEETIYKKMPQYFTKDDLRCYHPDASDSTINRILFKLRDNGVIMPLGKGRSARWMKIIKEDDPRILFGANYDRRD